MNVAVVIALCAFVALAYSETCTMPSDCMVTLCGNNTLICERGECTCQQATMSTGTSGGNACTALTDCVGLPHCHGDGTHGHGGSHGHEWHCIDGTCQCVGNHH